MIRVDGKQKPVDVHRKDLEVTLNHQAASNNWSLYQVIRHGGNGGGEASIDPTKAKHPCKKISFPSHHHISNAFPYSVTSTTVPTLCVRSMHVNNKVAELNSLKQDLGSQV